LGQKTLISLAPLASLILPVSRSSKFLDRRSPSAGRVSRQKTLISLAALASFPRGEAKRCAALASLASGTQAAPRGKLKDVLRSPDKSSPLRPYQNHKKS